MKHPLEQRLAAVRPNLIDDARTVAVFEDVAVTMFASKYNLAGTPGSAITLADLREPWDVDAHYTQYAADRRLLKEEAEEVRWFTVIAIDLDPITTATDDDFWKLVIRCYKAEEKPNLVYQTKRGAHLVWWLDPPLDDATDFERRRSHLVERLEPLLDKTAYRADPACKDWTRLFRTPRCVRTDKREDGTWVTTDLRDRPIWVLHNEGLDVTEWELPPAPSRMVLTTRRPATVDDRWAVQVASRWIEHQDGAVSGDGGHKTTFRVACALVGRFGLDEDAAYSLMESWNATCSPPWSERDLRHKIRDAMKAVNKERTDE